MSVWRMKRVIASSTSSSLSTVQSGEYITLHHCTSLGHMPLDMKWKIFPLSRNKPVKIAAYAILGSKHLITSTIDRSYSEQCNARCSRADHISRVGSSLCYLLLVSASVRAVWQTTPLAKIGIAILAITYNRDSHSTSNSIERVDIYF